MNAPYLWSNTELGWYINDTIADASIRAGFTVQDDIQIPFTQTGTTWNIKYNLDPGILDIQSVRLTSQPTYTLYRTSMRRQEQYYQGRPNYTSGPYSYALDLTAAGTGDYAGMFVRAITFIGSPTKADTALIDVKRLPATLESDQDIPEVDPMWQPDLIHGICGLAYLKRDSDTFDPKASAKYMQLFEDRFGPRLPAVVLRERQVEVPLEMILS
jgi:hypothetical protein